MLFRLGMVSMPFVFGESDESMLLQGKKVSSQGSSDWLWRGPAQCRWIANYHLYKQCLYEDKYPGEVIGDQGTPVCEGKTIVECAEAMNQNVETARNFQDAGRQFPDPNQTSILDQLGFQPFMIRGGMMLQQLLGPLLESFNFGSGSTSDPLKLPQNAEVRYGLLPGEDIETFYWKVTVEAVPGNATGAFDIAKKIIFDKTAENFDPTFIDEQDVAGLPFSPTNTANMALDQSRPVRLKFRRLDASPLLALRELLYLTVKTDSIDADGNEISLSTVPSVSNEWISYKYDDPPSIPNDFGALDFVNGPQVRSINLSPSLDRITKLGDGTATIEHVYTTKVGVVDFLPPALLRSATLQAYADEAVVVAMQAKAEVLAASSGCDPNCFGAPGAPGPCCSTSLDME